MDPCKSCGACLQCEPCNHCGNCRKCGKPVWTFRVYNPVYVPQWIPAYPTYPTYTDTPVITWARIVTNNGIS